MLFAQDVGLRGGGGISVAVLCLNLSIDHPRWVGWMVSATPRLLYPGGKGALYRRVGGPQGRFWTGAEILALAGILSPDCSARIESPYRLSYRGPHITLD
jgi:hypothetical protein